MGFIQKFANRSVHAREVEVLLANGAVDSVTIQPGGRVQLPAGSILHPDKEASYKGFLTVLDIPVPDPVPTDTTDGADGGDAADVV